MQKYCVSLKKAKEFKDAGWKKKTKLWWANSSYDAGYEGEGRWYCDDKWTLVDHKPLFADGYPIEFLSKYPNNEYDGLLTAKKLNEIICYPAPIAGEILEELSNNVITQYANEKDDWTEGNFIDLFRVPDALADCWLWTKKNNLLEKR